MYEERELDSLTLYITDIAEARYVIVFSVSFNRYDECGKNVIISTKLTLPLFLTDPEIFKLLELRK